MVEETPAGTRPATTDTGGTNPNAVGGFVSVSSLGNFTVASFVTALLWQIFGVVEILANRNGAMAAALVVGAALYFTTYNSDLSRPRQIGAALIGLINCFILYAAAIGIDVTFLGGTDKILP
jgi:hypothetical protein